MRTPIKGAAGTSSRTSSSRFVNNSDVSQATPVALPPGRLRLATSPNLTGSSPARKTSGIVALALRTPSAEPMPPVTMTDAPREMRSVASAGSRSNCPSAQRYSMTTFWPSTKPTSARPLRNEIRRLRYPLSAPLLRNPMTGVVTVARALRAAMLGRTADERNEFAPPHSNTSLARAVKAIGSDRPKAAAVLRLTAMKNRVDCSIGISAGFCPRAIRST